MGKQTKKIGSKTRLKQERKSAPDKDNWVTREERRMMELRLDDVHRMMRDLPSERKRLQEAVQTIQRELAYDRDRQGRRS